MGKAKRANLQKRKSAKSGAGLTGYKESSNPGGDITLVKNEKRKPWLGKFPVTDIYVPGLRFFLSVCLRIQSH